MALLEGLRLEELRPEDEPVDREEPDDVVVLLVLPVTTELDPTAPDEVAPPAAQLPSTHVAPATQSLSVSHTLPGITAVHAPTWTSRTNRAPYRQSGFIGRAA